jgi:F1F0 ATPase subunit 2
VSIAPAAAPLTVAAVVIAGFAAGGLLGWLFYGGLHLTVRELARARRPALLLGLSLVLRMAALLAGFWVLLLAGERWIGTGWPALVPALLGLIAARALLVRRHGPPGATIDKTRSDPR